jgi:pimeloyl-ACP methyl ester carboxylesterase
MVSEMLDRLGIDRAIVVGHSFAGTVATALALDHPARVAGLVLLAPVLQPWPSGVAWYYSLAATPVIGPLFAWTFALPVGAMLMQPTVRAVFAPQPVPPGYVKRAAIALVLRPRNFLANACDVSELKPFVTVQALRYAAIRVPTVIVTGDRDTIVSPELHSRALAAVLPHARLVMLEGIGHMPHHAASDRVVAAIDEVAAQAARA